MRSVSRSILYSRWDYRSRLRRFPRRAHGRGCNLDLGSFCFDLLGRRLFHGRFVQRSGEIDVQRRRQIDPLRLFFNGIFRQRFCFGPGWLDIAYQGYRKILV